MNNAQFVFMCRAQTKARRRTKASGNTVVKTEGSFLVKYKVSDADGDLLEYIKGFVHDKNGHCLKSELVQDLLYNWAGMSFYDQDFTVPTTSEVPANYITRLQEKMKDFENSDIYNGTGLSIETSKMTGRVIYKYEVPVVEVDDLIDMTSRFEIGVSVSKRSKRKM